MADHHRLDTLPIKVGRPKIGQWVDILSVVDIKPALHWLTPGTSDIVATVVCKRPLLSLTYHPLSLIRH